MYKYYYLIVLIGLLACSKKEQIEVPEVNVNKKVLERVYQNEIVTSLYDFERASKEFEKEADIISWPISEMEINRLRDLWKEAKLSWERLEVYDIGPVRSNYIKWQIDYWPTNSTLLETKISNQEYLQQPSYIHGLSASGRGLPAVEYLLFKERALEELNQDSLRWIFTRLLIFDVSDQQTLFKSAWDSYETSFLSNSELGINGSINILFNNVLNELELIVNNEIGTPLGIKGSNVVVASKLEGFYSKSTRDVILNTIIKLEKLYVNGFKELVVDASLNLKVQEQFNIVYSVLELNKSVEEDLNLNETTNFKLAHDEIQALLRMLKVEVALKMGVTFTIGDSDGD